MEAGGLGREPVDATSGNVLGPVPGGESTRGPWTSQLVGFTSAEAATKEDGMGPATDDEGRARVTRSVKAPAEAVWAVLADGWLYPTWVVGASRVRDVDATWPEPSSEIHHSFGVWPFVVNDETTCLATEVGRRMVLRPQGWPMGEAEVVITITPTGAETCDVEIVEDAVKGPGVLVPQVVRQPVVAVRNAETLQRLAFVAEGRHREGRARV